MSNIKDIIRVGLILFIITALSALLLAYANSVTAPLITENTRIKTENSMKTVLSTAEIFDAVEITEQNVVEAYKGMAGNELKGVCVITEANGYGGTIRVVTAVDTEGKVTGIDILSHSETPGLGANATKPEFKEQYVGKVKDISAVKASAEGNEINAMSGATITSKAVTEAVNTALAAADKLLATAN